MPIFMDRHSAPGAKYAEALKVHEMDLTVQDQFQCRCRTFWLDEERGVVNCLVEAPNAEAVVAMHGASHGEIPSKIMEVHPDLVMAFLGRLDDLHEDTKAATGGEAPVRAAFRAIMFTDLKDSTAMTTRLGDLRARELIREHDAMVRMAMAQHRGREVKHTGDGFMASFALANDALSCAQEIQRAFAAYNAAAPEHELHVRIGMAAGEPVEERNDLFGTAVQLAARICAEAAPGEILAHETIRELCAGGEFGAMRNADLKGFDQPVAISAVIWR